jgi:two-component system, chemotaxis family, chemotaxis protein CheY
MRILIVEDDPATQKLVQRYLSEYGDCDVTANGTEALNAFIDALSQNKPYDMICLDIMMPKMNGHQVLEAIRRVENDHEIKGLDGVKVIMTTALGDSKNVIGAFREGCEAYIVKPVKKDKLLAEMEKLGLIKLPVGK